MRARPDHARPRGRIGLRFKLMMASLVLVCFPVLAVWALGLYDEVTQWYTDHALDSIMVELDEQLQEHGGSIASLTGDVPWLRAFGENEHVYVRILSRDGRAVSATDPVHAEPLSALRTELSSPATSRTDTAPLDAGNAPDLAAFEATLPPESERPEVRTALAGATVEHRRVDDRGKLVVHYRAVPLRDRDGVAYVARFSARDIRTLYDRRYQLLKLTMVLALAAVLMGLWVGVRVVHPLVVMQQRIRAHMRDLSASESLALDRHDEIGALSRDFQRLRERLRGAIRETATVAADLAHDIKNPIATVRATAEMLGDGRDVSEDRRRRLVGALTHASQHMERSVEGMLKLARLDESLASTPRSDVDLSALVRELLDSYRRDPAGSGVSFSEHVEEKSLVHGSREDLTKMLRNVIDNAVAFCDETVHVALRRADGDWIVTVHDDGPGVSPGNRDKIFQRFFSSRPGDAPVGAGLGLAMARAVAWAHGGDLALELEGEFRGACFSIRLPARDADDST